LTLQWSISFQPISKKTQAKSAATGGNSLGLDGTDDVPIVLLTASWSSSSGDAAGTGSERLWEEVSVEARKLGVYHRFIYLNYAAKFQNPIQGYGDDNVANLAKVAEKYNPNGLFQTASPRGFKIPQ
jgi:hypothetical protein